MMKMYQNYTVLKMFQQHDSLEQLWAYTRWTSIEHWSAGRHGHIPWGEIILCPYWIGLVLVRARI